MIDKTYYMTRFITLREPGGGARNSGRGDVQTDTEIERASLLQPRSCPTRSQTLTYGGVVKLIVV